MHFVRSFLFCVSVTLLPHLSSECNLGTIAMSSLTEDHDIGTPLWKSSVITGSIKDATWFAIGDEGCDYQDVFKVDIDRSGGDGTFQVIFYPGDKFNDYVDIHPTRSLVTNTQFFYTCNEIKQSSPVVGIWTDKNNRAPEFVSTPTLTFTIDTNWDKKVPLNWGENIQISDKDHYFVNTQPLTFTTTRDDILRIEAIPLYQIGDRIPSEYLSDVKIFIKEDYKLQYETVNIDVTVSDGTNAPSSPISITLQIHSVLECESPPIFTKFSYYHKLPVWPKENYFFEPNPPIHATIPGDPTAHITYRLNTLDVQLTDPEIIDPRMLIFTRAISPEEGNQMKIVEVTATKVGTNLKSTVPLIIEYPPIPKPVFKEPIFESKSK